MGPIDIPMHQPISRFPKAFFVSEESDREIVKEYTNVAIIALQLPWIILVIIISVINK